MINTNQTQISRAIFAYLYEYIILRWEKEFSSHQSFNIRSKITRNVLKQLSIQLFPVQSTAELQSSINTIECELCNSRKSFFIFVVSSESQAKSIFRHLRNAVAHGKVERIKIGRCYYLVFKDEYRNSLTMLGQLPVKDLKCFVSGLYGAMN